MYNSRGYSGNNYSGNNYSGNNYSRDIYSDNASISEYTSPIPRMLFFGGIRSLGSLAEQRQLSSSSRPDSVPNDRTSGFSINNRVAFDESGELIVDWNSDGMPIKGRNGAELNIREGNLYEVAPEKWRQTPQHDGRAWDNHPPPVLTKIRARDPAPSATEAKKISDSIRRVKDNPERLRNIEFGLERSGVIDLGNSGFHCDVKRVGDYYQMEVQHKKHNKSTIAIVKYRNAMDLTTDNKKSILRSLEGAVWRSQEEEECVEIIRDFNRPRNLL